jgi:hypothetical protein
MKTPKQIVRIITMYSDGTFTDHMPMYPASPALLTSPSAVCSICGAPRTGAQSFACTNTQCDMYSSALGPGTQSTYKLV